MTDRAPYLDSEGEGPAGVVGGGYCILLPFSKQLGTRFDEKNLMSVGSASSTGVVKRCLQRGALSATRV